MLLLVVLIILINVTVAYGQSGGEIANSVANQAKTKFHDKASLQQNFINPAISGTPFHTFDNSKSFRAQISCPASNPFLEVFIRPSGTGDIDLLIARQDLNNDSQMDYSYSPNVPISGICANGFISCSPGTWTNCAYYIWSVSDEGKIIAENKSIIDLKSCYCINNYCGNNLVWNNLSIVLQTLGGGIAGALTQANPRYAVSDSFIRDMTIYFMGQDTKNCSLMNHPSLPGVTSPEGYFKNPYGITQAGEEQKTAQLSNPNSMYYIMSNSLAAREIMAERKTCSINRVINVTQENRTFSGNGNGALCVDHHLSARGRYVGNKIYLQLLDWNEYWHKNCGHEGHGDFEGWHTVRIIDLEPGFIPQSVNFCVSGGGSGCNSASNRCTYQPNQEVYVTVCPRNGAQSFNYNYSYTIIIGKDIISENIHNTCTALENDSQCKLEEEKVDEVYTYRSFNPTGLVPQESCRQFQGYTTFNECRSWWKKERIYLCEHNQKYDFSDAKRRFEKVSSTVRDDTLSLHYTDLRKGNQGNWIEENQRIDIQQQTSEDCEKACKTRKPKENTQVAGSGPVTSQQTTTQSYDFFYKLCDNNQCPIQQGEEIVKNCQCLNEFPEAASIMATLNEAGRDIICSSVR